MKESHDMDYGKMNTPLISVIIPIYNGEKFIERSVTSILNQPKSNVVEIILINDGSSDNSLNICTTLSRVYYQVSTFHTTNKGISAARNFGIKKAKGKYIAFLDQDDMWFESFLDDITIENIIESNADVLGFAYCSASEDLSKSRIHPIKDGAILGGGLKGAISSFRHHSSFLYKRSTILNNKIQIFKGRHEDETFRHMCLYCSKKIVYKNKVIFTRVNNLTSESHRERSAEDLYFEIINVWIKLKEWHKEHHPLDNNIQVRCDEHIAFMFLEMIQKLCFEKNSVRQIKNSIRKHNMNKLIYSYKHLNMYKKHQKQLEFWIKYPFIFFTIYKIKGLVFYNLQVLVRRTIYFRKLKDFVRYS